MSKFLTCRLRNRRRIKVISLLNSAWFALLVFSQSLLGDFFMVDSANISASKELLSFVAGGRTVTQTQLIQPTLTAFPGNPWSGAFQQASFTVGNGEAVPIGAERSRLLTHDFRLDTGGGTNPAIGNSSATLSFATLLVNGPGADLVFFELAFGEADPFRLLINSVSKTVVGSDYGPELTNVGNNSYFRTAGAPSTLSEMENDAVSPRTPTSSGIRGVAIDLSDFGVAPFASVNIVQFGSDIDINGSGPVDPVLFMGIQAVPEPSSIVMIALACLGATGCRWRILLFSGSANKRIGA